MRTLRTGMKYYVRLETGEEVLSMLETFAKKYDVRSASCLMIGAISRAELGYYTLSEKQYHWKIFAGEFEVLTSLGSISSMQDEPIVHMHGVFAGADFQAFGGHIKHATVGASCEVVISTDDNALTRVYDERTGLNLWSCKPGQ